MSMFDNYDYIPENYIPDNTHDYQPHLDLYLNDNNLNTIIDERGNIVGYEWCYGENVLITFDNEIKICVPNGSITSNVVGAAPTTSTVGEIGQKYYNLVDVKSWTMCYKLDNPDRYVWEQDPYLTYNIDYPQLETVVPNMTGKSYEIEIDNFRFETIKKLVPNDISDMLVDTNNVNKITVNIDPETSKEFLPGIYYISFYIVGEETRSRINTVRIHILSKEEKFELLGIKKIELPKAREINTDKTLTGWNEAADAFIVGKLLATKLNKVSYLNTLPTTNGKYILTCNVVNGVPKVEWELVNE